MPRKSWMRREPLIGWLALLLPLAGCSKTERTVDDILWSGGRFQAVTREHHYVSEPHGFSYSENSDKPTGQAWNYFEHPLPEQKGGTLRKSHFFVLTGSGDEDAFAVIGGSGLLIHEKLDFSGVTRCMVFDPETGRDISKPFSPAKGDLIFNRLRTEALAMVEGQAVVCDLLSARSGDLKMHPRPAWTALWLKSQAPDASVRFKLTADAQELVTVGTNYIIEASAADGTKEAWTIPLERRAENFIDAEQVGGQLLLFSMQVTYNDADLRISDLHGQILYSRHIPAQIMLAPSLDPRWDPARNEVLCLPTQFSPGDSENTLAIWNYSSNTWQNLPNPW